MSEPFKTMVFDDGDRTVITRLYRDKLGGVKAVNEIYVRVPLVTENMPVRYWQGLNNKRREA